ncbi:TRAP transporter small permease subunit [Limibaculum sp. M0105]|uniref:TRAP transporter small permease protein n=1 Tax=Thermohalobaculum xanthum TaxID=2753746 RepID=A0A8J7SDL0_9RHOB|nr:TRAP transporter small permease subunit [Thermohalobaculum xanthum]MBK0400127.1 TRAP transporter small permease subunit [Thermohalobaculum xanthum]
MRHRLVRWGRWLHRRADDIASIMLAVMFAAFICQVVFRYVLNLPVGWVSELSIVMWLWLVLWGAGFVLREQDEIRFDMIYGSVGPKARRAMTILFCLAALFLYGWSLPAAWDFVTFMKVQETSYLDIRYDRLFSIFILFAVAILVRYAWLLVCAVRGERDESADGGERS